MKDSQGISSNSLLVKSDPDRTKLQSRETTMYILYVKEVGFGEFEVVDAESVVHEEEEYDGILAYPRDGDPLLITDGTFMEGLTVAPVSQEQVRLNEIVLDPV